MLSHQRIWFRFDLMCEIVIFLLFVSPVHLFPRPGNIKVIDQSESNQMQTTHLETLNSKMISVNVTNDIEKPVFNNAKANYNTENEKSSTDTTDTLLSDQARQLNVPFIALPVNWMATFQPSNAVILTQKVPLRIWAIGSISKFPAFLEGFVQRIQSYYSTYKYHDLSRPASLGIISPQYHQYDTVGSAQIEPIEHDVVENDTDTPIMDDYDTTTDLNYNDEADVDENQSDESNGNAETEEIATRY